LRHRLIGRRSLLLLRLGLIVLAEQTSQEAGGMRVLRPLLLQLRDLRSGLVKRDVLHQHGLRKDVKRVRIRAKGLVNQIFGL
jgi:hypothetical protein